MIWQKSFFPEHNGVYIQIQKTVLLSVVTFLVDAVIFLDELTQLYKNRQVLFIENICHYF